MNHRDAGFTDHFTSQFIGITLGIDDGGDAGIDQHLGADDTGHIGAVQCRTIDVDAVPGGLDDGILLGMQTATEFMAFAGRNIKPFPQTTGVVAMADTGRHSIITGSQDVPLLDQNGADLPAQTGGAGSYQAGNVHEVLIPGWALHNL